MADDLGPAAIYGWLALPRRGPDMQKKLAGAVFLLDSDLAVTCAHVVRDHLGLTATPAAPPASPVVLRFEAFDTEIQATVVPEGWYPDDLGGPVALLRDVAFLCLSPPIEAEGLRYRALAPWVPSGGRPARVIGAEPSYLGTSQNVHVRLSEDTNSRRLWQIDGTSNKGFEVVRGFSGAPLLDETGTVIWGMVTEVDAAGRPVAFVIGAERLYEAWRRLSRKMSLIVNEAARSDHAFSIPEETRKLQEQVSRLNIERDAALRELEVLRTRLGSGA